MEPAQDLTKILEQKIKTLEIENQRLLSMIELNNETIKKYKSLILQNSANSAQLIPLNNNEVDLVYVQEGKLHLVEMKAGTSFNLGDISGFKQLEQTSWKKGENAIVCTTELLSALEDNTFILPITSI